MTVPHLDPYCSVAPCRADLPPWLLPSLSCLSAWMCLSVCVTEQNQPNIACLLMVRIAMLPGRLLSTSGGRTQTKVAVNDRKPHLPLHRQKGNDLDSVRSKSLVKITNCRTYAFSVWSQLPSDFVPPKNKLKKSYCLETLQTHQTIFYVH